MPTAATLFARPHTVGRFRLAAWGRYREANQLAIAAGLQNTPALRHGAIYLFGYVAEMVLKAAYFRLRPPVNGLGMIDVAEMRKAQERVIKRIPQNAVSLERVARDHKGAAAFDVMIAQ